jgi:hypothetical protein
MNPAPTTAMCFDCGMAFPIRLQALPDIEVTRRKPRGVHSLAGSN